MGSEDVSVLTGGNQVCLGDNLKWLSRFPDGSFQMIYIDPPFNTGKAQRRTAIKTTRDVEGSRKGFQGQNYRSEVTSDMSYADTFDDFLGFLAPRLEEAWRLLADSGTLYVHLDYREVHYAKVAMDKMFGRDHFLNEIIWAYDYGARSKRKWPAKHDNILVYVKNPETYHFDSASVDREPYMAPGLVSPEKVALGKLPTDCYSPDTQILTRGGWLPFPDLKITDEVASVSSAGELEYYTPTKLHKIPYQGEMIHFQAKSIDLLVTPNHRLYLKPKHDQEYQFIQADSLKQGDNDYYFLMNQTHWNGSEKPIMSVPSVPYINYWSAHPLPDFAMEDWCEFMGFYLSEGCTVQYNDRKEVNIAQINEEHKSRIAELLTKMGLTWRYDGHGFIICNKQLTLYLKQFGYAHEKFIPRELLALPRECLERLYLGLLCGDGNVKIARNGNDGHTYFTTSPQLADDVQELLIKLGYSATIVKKAQGKRHPNWRMRYFVYRRAAKESTIWPSRHQTKVDYDGLVWCCTVEPHHTLVVRRNGKMAVCGNCWWHTIVPTNGKEKTGYPTQKPLGILRRMVTASTRPGDAVLDFFAGSGTTGVAAAELGRKFTLVDSNPEAITIIRQRLDGLGVNFKFSHHKTRV